MAIGAEKTRGGTTTPSTALKTGTKNTTQAVEDQDISAGIFEGLYAVRENKSLLKEQKSREETDVDALWKAYKAGDPTAPGKLLSSLQPTIDAAISGIVGGDQRYLTKARLMALDSFNGFDPKQGVSLNTYVYNRLKGLQRIAADRGNFIHVPERSSLERRQLEAIKQDYILETGMEPSLAALADRSGMPLRKVSRLMSIFGTTSTSATRGEHGDSLESQKRTADELYTDTFYNELPEMDKKIYEWSTGYGDSPKLDRATIAKTLQISEAAVSQHASKIDRAAAKFNQALSRSLYGE